MLMSIPAAKQVGKQFEAAPPGMHLGRLYKILHVGTSQNEWNGEVKTENKIIFQFELHGDDDQGKPLVASNGKPYVLSKYYNLTLHEKAKLRLHLTTWLKLDFKKMQEDGEQIDFKKFLGQFAMVNVVRTNTGTSGIDSLMPVPQVFIKAGLPEGVNELFMFEINNFDPEKFEKLSEGTKELVKKSFEYRKMIDKKKPEIQKSEDNMNDDIPF